MTNHSNWLTDPKTVNIRPSGYYWIRLTPSEGVVPNFDPEVARWEDAILEWEVAGSDDYFQDDDVTVLSSRLELGQPPR